jgi:hypothetical protein
VIRNAVAISVGVTVAPRRPLTSQISGSLAPSALQTKTSFRFRFLSSSAGVVQVVFAAAADITSRAPTITTAVGGGSLRERAGKAPGSASGELTNPQVRHWHEFQLVRLFGHANLNFGNDRGGLTRQLICASLQECGWGGWWGRVGVGGASVTVSERVTGSLAMRRSSESPRGPSRVQARAAAAEARSPALVCLTLCRKERTGCLRRVTKTSTRNQFSV